MKLRLGRGATIAAAAVAASLFFMLCMVFYGREDFLAPERILERGDALRFRIASLFVQPFGAGAYLGFGIVFAWSVVAYFRESVGSVLPRVVGMAACIPSFCAMTSLASGPHEFWSGSVGTWMGDVVYRGFGPVIGWAVVGTLFLVSFAMATEFGFYSHLSSLRGSLSFPLLPPEEAGEAEAPQAGTAVLEPGDAEPVESWKVGGADEPAFDLSSFDASSLDASGLDLPAVEEASSSDAVLVDREQHLADIRSRAAAGATVTEAEQALLTEAENRDAMADAIDALFGAPGTEIPPAAPLAPPPAIEEAVAPEADLALEAPAAPAGEDSFSLSDLPPFLVSPTALHPLMQQQVESEGPLFLPPPAGPAHARIITPEEIAQARQETEEMESPPEVEDEIVTPSAHFIFSGVEFMPPNEELADPTAPEPVEAPALPEPEPEPVPAVPEVAQEPAASIEAEPAPVAAPAAGAVEPVVAFEDEFFSFGIEEEGAAPVEPSPAAEVVMEPEAPVEVEAEPAPLAAAPEAVEEAPALDEIAADLSSDADWLAVAARDLALDAVVEEEPVAAPEPEAGTPAVELLDPVVSLPDPLSDHAFMSSWLSIPMEEPEPVAPAPAAVEPEVEAEAEYTAEEELLEESGDEQASILERLFGDPVIREEVAFAPHGPSQSEPREPPANLMPIFETPVDGVTLLSDPVVGDCLKDHGIEIDQEVMLPAMVLEEESHASGPAVVEVEAPAPADAPSLSAEEAAEGILASLAGFFTEPLEETEEEPPVASPAAVEEEPDALDAHGWGALFPSMFKDGESAVEERVVEVQAMEPMVVEAEVVEPAAAEPAAAEVVDVPAPVAEETAAEEEIIAPVDEALVNRLVEELREEESAPAPAEEVEVIPAVVLPEAASAPAVPGEVDELYSRAMEAVKDRGRGSVVVLQRKLGIGFTRATKIIDQLVTHGVLGAENASGSHPLL